VHPDGKLVVFCSIGTARRGVAPEPKPPIEKLGKATPSHQQLLNVVKLNQSTASGSDLKSNLGEDDILRQGRLHASYGQKIETAARTEGYPQVA
jgi:hypothetical protein